MHKFKLLILALFSILSISVLGAIEADLVTEIPNYPSITSFKTYSGQLILDQDAETKKIYKSIHYVFVTAINKPEEAPLVLWLNGGPGCSSLQGWLKEIGPFVMEDGKTEFEEQLNQYSWNLNANLLFFESPAGVGFSIIDETKYPKYGDQFTHDDNYKALLKFYEGFPEYRTKNFYITGESYAGIYIPHLAKRIIDRNKDLEQKILLKGLAIGNGVIDWSVRVSAQMDYAWGHQLYSSEIRQAYVNSCSIDQNSPRCRFTQNQVMLLTEGINPYNIYGRCYKNPAKGLSYKYSYTPWYERNRIINPNANDDEDEAPCTDDKGLNDFLNVRAIKEAINVNPDTIWEVCNFNVYRNYDTDKNASLQIMPDLFKSGIDILFYSGDIDMVVPFTEFFAWGKKLNLKVKSEWQRWMVEDQVAGFVTKYEDNFTFLTVKGAGHMVPTDQRQFAYEMFTRFLSGGNY